MLDFSPCPFTQCPQECLSSRRKDRAEVPNGKPGRVGATDLCLHCWLAGDIGSDMRGQAGPSQKQWSWRRQRLSLPDDQGHGGRESNLQSHCLTGRACTTEGPSGYMSPGHLVPTQEMPGCSEHTGPQVIWGHSVELIWNESVGEMESGPS